MLQRRRPPSEPIGTASAPPAVDRLPLLDPRRLFAEHDLAVCQDAIRRLALPVSAGPDILCRVLGAYKMFVGADDRGLGPHLALDGYWESDVTRFVARRVQPGMTCIDAGANVGYYALLMAGLAGPRGRVLAVEPNPDNVRRLRANVGLNASLYNTTVHEAALSARPGETVRFSCPVGEPKNGRILAPDDGVDSRPHAFIDVVTDTVDNLPFGRADFVKIDVEGGEEDLWAGMRLTLDHCPDIQVVMEFNWRRCREPERFLADISARFPLRRIGSDGEAHPVDADALRSAADDVMLYLSRR